MRFFIDFEATQYSERIISIGCITDSGATFSTLVKPTRKKDKVTQFITDLTGITNEMLATAPSVDDAFNSFFDFVLEHSPTEPNEFYCYGNSDKVFIEKTLNDITSTRAATFAKRLKNSLIDYSNEVQQYLKMGNHIALRKVYSLILNENVVQRHNALEDAEMLCTVVKNLKTICAPDAKEKIEQMPKTVKPVPNADKKLKRAPAKFVNWPANKWEADTGANKDNWAICCKVHTYTKYFDSMETAILWVMRYASKGMSPKNLTHYEIIRKKIEMGFKGAMPYSFTWEKNDGLGEI